MIIWYLKIQNNRMNEIDIDSSLIKECSGIISRTNQLEVSCVNKVVLTIKERAPFIRGYDALPHATGINLLQISENQIPRDCLYNRK